MAIVALVLWVITAAAGVSLLSTGGAARRLAAEAARAQADSEQTPAGSAPAAAGGTPTTASATSAVAGARPAAIPARYAAAPPRTDDGRPPPVPRVRVSAPPGEHPLLEFSHPAMAVFGLAGWFAFVFVHYRPFAWFSLGILAVTIGLGLTWLIRNAQAVRHQARAAWRFPRRLVVLHGLAAATGISLTVLTALSATHG